MEYEIGKRERTNFLDDRGRSVDGYRIWYMMEDGMTDYVEVEKSQYKAETVWAMIEKGIAAHRALIA